MAYTEYPAASCESSDSHPSTPEQLVFADALAGEMRAIGLADVVRDEHGYLYGTIPASAGCEAVPTLGLIAHMDVTPEVPAAGAKPRLVKNYDGGDIALGAAALSPKDYPELLRYVGNDLVVTDGRTLLGADDRAGVAEILCAAERLLAGEAPHGRVRVAFTPDEEVGRGADLFDVPFFGAEFAYTVDGSAVGEVEYETFNAAAMTVSVKGKNIHPGYAKGKLINSILVANEFLSLLPAMARPERTEGREGFFHVLAMSGDVEHSSMSFILRDHDEALLECKKEYARRAAAALNEKYGEGTVSVVIADSYKNMRPMIEKDFRAVELARKAVREVGLEPCSPPVRGGTDGSRLSYMGLPCPNLGTGSHNHHSRFEFASADAMDRSVDILVIIARLCAEQPGK